MPDFTPGQKVILDTAPTGLLSGLPEEDQQAILGIVGKPVLLAGYSYGQAELEFFDEEGDGHTIWIEPSKLRLA